MEQKYTPASLACIRSLKDGTQTIHDYDGRMYGRVVRKERNGTPGFSIVDLAGAEFDWTGHHRFIGQIANKLIRDSAKRAYQENTDERKHLPLKGRLQEAEGLAGFYRMLGAALK